MPATREGERPVIGICSRPDETGEHTYIAQNYASRVTAAGGIPVGLPYCDEAADMAAELMGRIDGLLLTGGGDVCPDGFGGHPYADESHAPIDGLLPDRDSFEWAAAKAAWAIDLPCLGVCRGVQVLNVVHGGTLARDVSELGHANEIDHVMKPPFDRPYHHVRIDGTSRLGEILRVSEAEVNSIHHQAICSAAPDAKVVAWANDGTIEAIEFDQRTFFMGVQWHPEITGSMPLLFRAFVGAAEDKMQARGRAFETLEAC
ncbi:MAG: gamma-glutamyl-gamma-aminobutyrate hydrolase family protein [Atopobiaceae bacterium]|jgi:putative glutamine amidotransferase|nr:gamma-glutamyl-gamma-aminobutyrate hydrolase family protein [Atopobiaceae bacterium]MCI2173429.1 gamma-glutamyl-gamma-aminobutyrate hydrolase family protein [Atopobiaceae bacterium]MCI2207424.1 gamma-glutamyl-gamma-aminobutyrate hydrolase family protein [Atopobiaceae bacterium]